MGFILIVLSILPYIKVFFNKLNIMKIVLSTGLIVIFGLIFSINSNFFTFDKNELSATIFDRMFTENQKSAASTDERIESIKNGFKASTFSNLILPPGNFYFRSKWKNVIAVRHYPHSSFIYMLVEYGIYLLWPLFLMYLLYKKSKQTKLKILFLIMMTELLFLPNIVYYSTIFLVVFYIEMQYEYCRNFTILKE